MASKIPVCLWDAEGPAGGQGAMFGQDPASLGMCLFPFSQEFVSA